jgi:hypothetical protein
MHIRAPLVGAILVLGIASASVQAEQPRDAADLFPAQTLAYLEFRQPDRLSREVAALLRGSAFEDMPAVLAKHREKRGDDGRFFFEEMIFGEFTMFASPEVVAEFGRLGGGAVALTGFTKDLEPEIVGILLSGNSNGPTFVMRTILTVDNTMRKIDECEGIALYRDKRQDFRKPVVKGGPAPVAEPRGPTLALLPDGFIIGSTTESVKLMIQRLKGKISDPALSSVAAFRDAAKLRDKPGLFGYADLGALHIQLEEAMKNAGAAAQLEWDRIKTLVNPKAGTRATLSFTLQNGDVELNARIGLEANETSQLIDLLPNKKANLDALHFVPKDAGMAFAASLSDGEKRWAKYAAIVEALDKADGKRGPTAAKQIAELEKALNLRLGKDVFAKITDAIVVVDPLILATHGRPRLVVLTATDEEAAKSFEDEIMPKIAGLIPPGQAKPTQETTQGLRINSLPFDLLGQGTRLHYGRHGKTLVFGLNGPDTAGALAGGAKKAGLLGEAKTAAALKETGEASVVGLVSLSSVLPLLLPQPQDRFRKVAAPGAGGAPAAPPKPTEVDPFKAKLAKELAKVTESLPPATLSMERTPDQITLVLRQQRLKTVFAKVVNRVVESSLDRLMNQGGDGAGEAVAPPAKQ